MDGDNYDRETGEVAERRGLPALPELPRAQNLIFASPECGAIFGALCDMQGKMEAPKRTKSAKVKGRTKNGGEYEYSYDYAPLDEIIRAMKEPMSQSGLAYRQFLSTRGGSWVMRTVIGHKETGEWFGCDYPIFWDEQRGMQGFASGVTYARRYGLMMALGIAAEDDDDANVADGNQAQVASRPRTAQGAPGGGNGSGQGKPATEAIAEGFAALKTEARKRHSEIRDIIDKAETVDDVVAIRSSPAYAAMEKHVRAADPGEIGEGVLKRLADRADQRIAELEGGR